MIVIVITCAMGLNTQGEATAAMLDRERFIEIMSYRKVDRIPAYYFGLWDETLVRWKQEGLKEDLPLTQQAGLDDDWERGMWGLRGLSTIRPVFHDPLTVIEETDSYRIVRHPSGAITRESKLGSSIPQHLKEALEPTWESWRRFKAALDPDLPERRIDPGKLEAKAQELNNQQGTVCLFGGSLYGWARDWMGVEAISMLAYDDPAMYEEIIDTQANLYMRVTEPILKKVQVDFIYIFEDCCGKSGPLFSPDTYRRFYHRYYERLVRFYKDHGAKYVLLDSDGYVDPLIGCWLDSGIDIVFPIEVGTWRADPVALRRQYGKRLRMMGGFDKHLIARGEMAVRDELKRLKPLTEEGGFIPLPDHRIPPNCSWEQFKGYVKVFREILG